MTSKRNISTLNEGATLSEVVHPILFARLDFTAGVYRFHTEIGRVTATHPIHGPEIYTGVGDFGGIDGNIKETVEPQSQQVQLRITGVRSAFNNLIITSDSYHRDAEVMLGLLDTNGDLVDDPEILFSGFMDKPSLALGPQLGVVTLNLESRALHLQKASDWRFTDEDLQIEYPGDLMGEYIYRMADLQLIWGDRPVGTGSRGGWAKELLEPEFKR